uniref:Uncharacterized protein n=1 Tax=Anguilla anguilla TaxID=7936 RepID=A0A0E9SHL3_ANGAN
MDLNRLLRSSEMPWLAATVIL